LNRRDFLAAAAVASWPARAQTRFPDRPIKLIVPFAPGGVVDVIARIWAAGIEKSLGAIAIENQGAAGGTAGAGAVARAAPDGYTLLMGNTSTQVINPAVMEPPPYDPGRAFAAISIVANSAVAFAVHPSIEAKTLAEFVALMKANPGRKFSFGSPGAGTLTHLTGEIFKRAVGLPDYAHIPYRGAGPGMNDLVGGHIPSMIFNITGQGLELHKAGKIRIIGVASPKRLDVLADVPTCAEFYPAVVAQLFTGLFAPAGTPRAIIEQVANANLDLARDAAFRKKLIDSGLEPVADTPEEANTVVEAELKRLAPLAKEIGFKPE
jgi:tripartite-type tricarboxylate transporter receptor subunit TctC